MKYTDKEKRALYESIMRDVAVSVKKHLNELSFPTMKRAQRKRVDYFKQDEPGIYRQQTKKFIFVPSDKITVFDSFVVRVNLKSANENMTIKITGRNYKYEFSAYGEIDDDKGSVKLNNTEWQLYDIEDCSYILGEPSSENDWWDAINTPISGEPWGPDYYQGDLTCRLFSLKDARKLTSLIYNETGIMISYSNFTSEEIVLPDIIIDYGQE